MVMLSWTKLNPTVNQLPVNKLFYNKFFYKIKIYCPASRLLESKTFNDLLTKLSRRFEVDDITYNYAGSWYLNRRGKEIKEYSRIEQLEHYFKVKMNYVKELKYRIEEPYLSIYSNDEQLLYNIAEQYYPERCLEIHKPVNDKATEIISKGEIISKTIDSYNYKIIFKSMYFDNISLKHSLADYLYNLKDEIKISNAVKRNLTNNKPWFNGGYLYSKTIDVTTFMNLICPNLISGIFKMTKLDS